MYQFKTPTLAELIYEQPELFEREVRLRRYEYDDDLDVEDYFAELYSNF